VFDDTTMIVWGGIAKHGTFPEAITNEALRLRRIGIGANIYWQWDPLTLTTNPAPGARFGHKAIYDAPRRRMIVFGGVADTSGGPTDTAVWALQVHAPDTLSATWSQLPVVDPSVHPSARYDHSLEYVVLDGTYALGSSTYSNVKSAIVFGGRSAGGVRNNDLWRLVFVGTDSVRWIPISNSGTVPSPRSAHSATIDQSTQHMYVLGGRTSNGAVGDTTWMVDLSSGGSSATWYPFTPRGMETTAWHTAVLQGGPFNRLPEVFNPLASSGTQWSHTTTGHPYLLQEWYPQMFLAPNGKVFNSGPSDSSYYLNPADWQWSAYPATGSGNMISGFKGGSAVMYLPGKVMKCGTRDTEVNVPGVGTTKTIDLIPSSGATWQPSGSMVYGRVNMNLTLLPTGKVLVTGGTGWENNDTNPSPVLQPEIWDPADSNGVGAWRGGAGSNVLSSSTVPRGYHSTALLLPDGRILCAGGNGSNIGDSLHYGDVFCPPYLFRDGSPTTLATRPTHRNAPAAHVTWGKVFTIATDSAASIKSVCMIKPGATTHAFNQDQRYVPLSFVRAPSPSRLFVTTSANDSIAPPGDYMLFMVDSTATASQVPSIATWMKIDANHGRDSADVTAPKVIDDLALDVSSTSVYLQWTAPADDDTIAASGPLVQSYDIRRKTSSMLTESAWASGTSVGAPTIEPVGNYQGKLVSGLTACTTYHFGVRATDDNTNKSALPPDVYARTLCGGGGGGDAAQWAGGEVSASPASAPPSGGVVIVRTTCTGSGTWRIDARQAATTTGLGLEDTTGMFIQMPAGRGGYKPALHLLPGADDTQIGLCALRDGRRVVLAGGYTLQAIASRLHSGSSDCVLASAVQGSVGDLGAGLVAAGGGVKVATGDSLTLIYQTSSTTVDSAGSWFATVANVGTPALTARLEHPGGIALPLRFALRQNQPNPFTAATTIRFDLPVGALVRLELFDAQGRRVTTLANRFFPAGYQSVRWDPSQSDGGQVGPGVYFYRIQAGPFRDRKKMVLLGH